MAKYTYIELDINKHGELDLSGQGEREIKALKLNNAIYIYRGTKSKKIYVGQTIHFIDRHKQHYDGTEDKFNKADFDKVIVIFSVYFNRSALDDVESQLITYFSADNSKSSKMTIGFDSDVINRTGGNSVNEYTEKENVATEVILPFWEEVLYPNGWVSTPTLDELRTRALVKYSPIKILTPEQSELINEIIHNPNKNYVINGDAGTGKTVLLTHLVASYLLNTENVRIGVVVQPNWEKTAQEIFKIYGMNTTYLTITTSTKLIKDKEEYDVIIVDESHKLSRKYGKQHPSFNQVYDIAGFEHCESHLEIIQKLGKQIILMYDVLQAIRPCNVTRDMFKSLTSDYEKKFLTTQFRIQTSKDKPYTSEDYVNGIKYLLYKDTGLLSSDMTNFNPSFNKGLFSDKSKDAYFGYFASEPLKNLIAWVEEDNNYNPEHVNRVLAGLVEPWQQSEGKNPSKMHFFEGAISRRWNSTQENWINSKDPDAKEQIGSVFAVQGIDLNAVGVLIGADLKVGDDGKLVADPTHFFNTNGTFTEEEMDIQSNKDEFTLFVLNIYYVLLTRGIDGIRLGFWKNDKFMEYMKNTLSIL